ncbi:hypothetical protein HAX54_046628 [Datura stramonium]|uniref:Uncharacterized protein n=1 Tax=Datura stramonium TaxID=4076 RepID=A0ABS8WJD1_DATST|nr:hypothetical protein [Datura stramonium]
MLDCFHGKSSVSKWSSEVAALDDVFAELLGLMSSNCEKSDHNSFSKMLKVRRMEGLIQVKYLYLGNRKCNGWMILLLREDCWRMKHPKFSGQICCMKGFLGGNTRVVHHEGLGGNCLSRERDTNLKQLLQSEYEAELDSIKKKYNLLFQIAERKLAEKLKDIDTKYNLMHKNPLLAEAMTQAQDTVESIEMTVGTRQSSPHRPSSVPEMTASILEPVNSEQRAADPRISSENFSIAAIPSLNAELPSVEEPAVVPPRTSSRATLQTASSADLPTSGSRAIPTTNYQSVILTPSQLSTQTLGYATTPGASCEQRRPAPHLRPFRPLPTMNSWNDQQRSAQ